MSKVVSRVLSKTYVQFMLFLVEFNTIQNTQTHAHTQHAHTREPRKKATYGPIAVSKNAYFCSLLTNINFISNITSY